MPTTTRQMIQHFLKHTQGVEKLNKNLMSKSPFKNKNQIINKIENPLNLLTFMMDSVPASKHPKVVKDQQK